MAFKFIESKIFLELISFKEEKNYFQGSKVRYQGKAITGV